MSSVIAQTIEAQRARVLLNMDAPLSVTRELLQDESRLSFAIPTLPLQDEAHIARWQIYRDEAKQHDAVSVLRRYLPQLAFPVRAGMSGDDTYMRATRQGVAALGQEWLELQRPSSIEVQIHDSALGCLPVILVPERADFVMLVQALVHRNEPVAVPEDVGAFLVSGYVNWDRVAQLRATWAATARNPNDPAAWAEELRLFIRPHPALYHDRFVIATDMPYSGVPAAYVGMEHNQWLAASRAIRLHHEHMHATVQRLSSKTRTHLHDELLADYYALGEVFGSFKSDTFLRCLGVDTPGQGRRWDFYVERQRLSRAAQPLYAELVREAARTLEALDQRLVSSATQRAHVALRLLSYPLELIAVPDSLDALATACLPEQGEYAV